MTTPPKYGPDTPVGSNPLDTTSDPGSREHPLANPVQSFGVMLGSIVDDARQLVTDLGLRPYRVFCVIVQWTGGEIGRGECRVFRTWELLPTPKLDETSGIRGEPKSGGVAERGTVKLRRISTSYTEEQVRGLVCGNALPKNQEGWIEVVEDARGGLPRRRRFIVTGQPYLDMERSFEWTVTLLRQDQDRARDGVPYPYER